MSNAISTLIQADLTALTNAAADLAQNTITPANIYPPEGQAAGGSFSQSMQDAVSRVNEADATSGQRLADVDAGKSDDLVGAMLASQEASLSFSMLMQVRNKVMGAVDELIKLPL